MSKNSEKETNPGEIQGLSAEDYRLCEEAFDLFDKDGDGTMDTNELKHLLRCFERDSDDLTIKKLISKYDKDNLGSLTFESIVEILKPEFKHTDEIDVEITQCYKVFDRNDKGIDAHELSSVMNSLLEKKYEDKMKNEPNGVTDQDKFKIPVISLEDA